MYSADWAEVYQAIRVENKTKNVLKLCRFLRKKKKSSARRNIAIS